MKVHLGANKFLIFIFINILFSAVLFHHHIVVNESYSFGPSFCTVSDVIDCDEIAKSKFSEIAGIPVAGLSLAFSFFILFSFLFFARREVFSDDIYKSVILVFSLILLLPSIVMASISFFILKKICLLCSVLYLNSLVLFILAFLAKEGSFIASLKKGVSNLVSFVSSVFDFSENQEKKFSLSRIFLLFAVFFIAISYAYPSTLRMYYLNKLKKENYGLNWRQFSKISFSQGSSLGKGSSNLTIIEFSDFECPFCKEASKSLKETISLFSGKVNLVFKHYPLDHACNSNISKPFHRLACRASKISLCASKSDPSLFWPVHDALFSLERLSMENLDTVVNSFNLSSVDFNQCLESSDTQRRIQEDIDLANALDVRGTPSVFIYQDGKITKVSIDFLNETIRFLLITNKRGQ